MRMTFCPECGRQRSTSTRYCPSCGRDFGVAATGSAELAAEPDVGSQRLDSDAEGSPPTMTMGPTGPALRPRRSRSGRSGPRVNRLGSGWRGGARCGFWLRSSCCSRPAAARSRSSTRPEAGRRRYRTGTRRPWRRAHGRRRPNLRSRSRRACRHPLPPRLPRPRPPPPSVSPSVVSVAPGVKPASAQVEIVLSHYFQGINKHNYAEYASSQTAQGKADQPEASFDSGYATTADSRMTLTSLTPTGAGDLTATVTFTSRQSPADSVDQQRLQCLDAQPLPGAERHRLPDHPGPVRLRAQLHRLLATRPVSCAVPLVE